MKYFTVALSAWLLTIATPVVAQSTAFETSLAADVVNQYVWRGQDCGNISVQPTLGISWRGLSLTAWGSVGFDKDDTKELDLTAAYAVDGFNVGFTDYWFNVADGRYFVYAAHKTAHVFEGTVGYDFGAASVQWFTVFGGNDGVRQRGKRAYSSYAEVSVPFRLGGTDWTATVGAVPYATSLYDADGFAITQVAVKASKELKLTDRCTLPVFAGIIANPAAERSWLIFGLTLRP